MHKLQKALDKFFRSVWVHHVPSELQYRQPHLIVETAAVFDSDPNTSPPNPRPVDSPTPALLLTLFRQVFLNTKF